MAATAQKDYYGILGVKKSAATDDIRKAFRKLARKYHPDVNPNDKKAEEKFKEISEANDVLIDPAAAEAYARGGGFGAGGFGAGAGGRRGSRSRAQDFNFSGFDFSDLGGAAGRQSAGAGGFRDIFSSIFGGRGGAAPETGPIRGS